MAKMKKGFVVLAALFCCALSPMHARASAPGSSNALSDSAKDIYSVQAGAFREFENARRNYEKVRDMPYARVEKIGEVYVVRIGKFKRLNESESLLKKVKVLYKDAFRRKVIYDETKTLLPQVVVAKLKKAVTPADQHTASTAEAVNGLVANDMTKEESGQVNGNKSASQDEKPQINARERGLAAEMAGQWDKAVDIYKSMLTAQPQRADLWVRIADIEARLGRKEEVIRALKKAAEASPQDPELHFRLSQAYSVADRPDEALAQVSIAVGFRPGNTQYLSAQARIAGWLGQYDLAIKNLSELIKLYPHDDNYLRWLAELQLWSGQLDRAARNYRDYLHRHPEDRTALLELVKAEVWRGNFSAAEKFLDKYRDLEGENRDYWSERAMILAAAQRPRAAIAVITGHLRPEAGDYDTEKSKVIAWHYLNDNDDALKGLAGLENLRPLSRETADMRRFVKTGLRDFIEGGFLYYNDSDHLSRYNSWLRGGYFLNTQTTVLAGLGYDRLTARVGSGLENVNGSQSASHEHIWAGLSHRFSTSLALEGDLGIASAGGSNVMTYRLSTDLKPADGFSLTFTRDYGYYLISPRTVSMGIRQGYNGLDVSWSPDFLYTFDTTVSYSTLSDDNYSWEAIFGPRRAVMRSERFNIDLGTLALWDGFEKTLNDGYYSPKLYQLYGLRGFTYWKLSDDNGVSAMALMGMQKDNAMNGFRSALSLDVEGTFGLYREWMLKVRTGITNNLRQATGAFRAIVAGIALTKRF